jgi:hypothetical protein
MSACCRHYPGRTDGTDSLVPFRRRRPSPHYSWVTSCNAVVGNSRLPLMKLEGKLEDTPPVNADELVEKIVNESPAIRIADLGVKRAEAALARTARNLSIPAPGGRLRIRLHRQMMFIQSV